MASVFVTQDRVTAPPDRFIDVSDRALVRFFQGVFSPQQEDQVAILHQLMLGISAQDFADLRRRLEGEFEFFACAAAGKKSRVKIGSFKEERAYFVADELGTRSHIGIATQHLIQYPSVGKLHLWKN